MRPNTTQFLRMDESDFDSLAVPSLDRHRGSIRGLISHVLSSVSPATSTTSLNPLGPPDEVVKAGQLADLKKLIHHNDVDAKT